MDQDSLRLRIAIICSTTFIIASFVFSYFLWGHDGLPMGWDTPHYIEESKIVSSQGPSALLAFQGPYDFVYQLVSGVLVWLGVSAVELEIFLPLLLLALIPYLLSKLALIHPDPRMALIGAVAVPGWYALYQIGAELHANLLGLVLILAALPLLFRTKSIRQSQCILGLGLFGVASFTHIETTLFFVIVIIISSVVRSIFPLRIALLTAVVAVPAAVIYVIHFLQLVELTGYSLPVYNLEPILFWLEVFGTLLPLAAYGFISSIIGRRSKLEALITIWAAGSLLIGASQYLDPQTYTFAQRAATIIPAPLLAAFGLIRLRSWANKPRQVSLCFRNLRNGVLVAAFILLAGSWPLTYWTAAEQYHQVYLTSSAYQRLEWISSNMRFANTPVFVYNDVDLNAGGQGDLYSNWVGAIIGSHLSYLGRVDYLVQVRQTPFSNVVSRLHSAVFMKQINDAGITNRSTLLNHPIVIVEDFYYPFPMPTYFASFFHQVSDGVFEGDNTMLASLNNVTLPLSSSAANSIGPWQTANRSWARSVYALEAHVNSTSTNLEASFLLGIASNGTYTIGFRYWDGTGNNVEIALDGATVGRVQYRGSNAPLISNFTGISLTSGIHDVVIKVDPVPGQQYASLDFLSVSRQ